MTISDEAAPESSGAGAEGEGSVSQDFCPACRLHVGRTEKANFEKCKSALFHTRKKIDDHSTLKILLHKDLLDYSTCI